MCNLFSLETETLVLKVIWENQLLFEL